ncbi:phosphatidylserine decarboxylase [Stereum hirsutum FP-91666 SS1]|uniref:phosphatidylserine decarboxylase n=1 Tax=Stereum hirsutum (strain FP-91666) TaxID=721885 RepID=UPI000440F4DC|nr:phosphatidylserine decarboxylase [Stereum hirsutum FP-91666 SS1]EIM91883.1 phosphatidylserine decarboxylase [Stereum hirsutum FP-91666 SS1]
MVWTERASEAWRRTPTKWYPLPWFVGAMLLVLVQWRRTVRKEAEVHVDGDGHEVVRLRGPWQVHILGALPLRNLSRVWGYLNSLELPLWFRPYGYKIYASLFGCDLSEIEPSDLHAYPSMGAFFYRALKPGARPIDASAPLVSPADGTVLHFGKVEGARVEQVKGLTYSLDALLGLEDQSGKRTRVRRAEADLGKRKEIEVVDDEEFANVNGIEYSLNQLIGGAGSTPSTPVTPSAPSHPTTQRSSSASTSATESTDEEFPTDPKAYSTPSSRDRHPSPQKHGERIDASVVEPDRSIQETLSHDVSVAKEMGVSPTLQRTRSTYGATVRPGNALYFMVVYLAPGDYHRFHSPTAWVVEKRRHFMGELFSVSPYVAKRLENLFVLNERVALLGRWRHGFFSMIPVGATNVGSIKINFDQQLRTNLRHPRRSRPPPGTYEEATYSAASPILNGQPLSAGEEMGGFCLGSTIVLVWEAPEGREGWEFGVGVGEKVKVGQGLGRFGSGREKVE